jgi:hypothetical protein
MLQNLFPLHNITSGHEGYGLQLEARLRDYVTVWVRNSSDDVDGLGRPSLR